MIRKAYRKRWPRKNLGELLNFLEEQHPDGVSIQAVSQKMDTCTGNISRMFHNDDMKLSMAEHIADVYGYRLNLFFPVRSLTDGYEPAAPRRTYDNAGNLSGLIQYIQDSEYSIPFVAEQTHVSVGTVRNAFIKGDIKISTLNSILDALAIQSIWKFTKKDNIQ